MAFVDLIETQGRQSILLMAQNDVSYRAALVLDWVTIRENGRSLAVYAARDDKLTRPRLATHSKHAYTAPCARFGRKLGTVWSGSL